MKWKLKIKHPKADLSEAGQTIPARFAFCNRIGENELEVLSLPAKCRDYLGDALFQTAHNVKVTEYGFCIEKHVDMKNPFLVIVFPAKENFEAFKKNVSKVIHPIEDKNNFTQTKVFDDVEGYKNPTVILSFSPKWVKSIMMISFFTFLCKCCMYSTEITASNWKEFIKNNAGTERGYLSSFSDKEFEVFCSNLHAHPNVYWISGFAESVNAKEGYWGGAIHNHSGFVSIAGYARQLLKHSKEDQEKLKASHHTTYGSVLSVWLADLFKNAA